MRDNNVVSSTHPLQQTTPEILQTAYAIGVLCVRAIDNRRGDTMTIRGNSRTHSIPPYNNRIGLFVVYSHNHDDRTQWYSNIRMMGITLYEIIIMRLLKILENHENHVDAGCSP